MYSKDWSITNQHLALDPSPIYRTPLDDPILVHDTIFTKRTDQSHSTRNNEIITTKHQTYHNNNIPPSQQDHSTEQQGQYIHEQIIGSKKP